MIINKTNFTTIATKFLEGLSSNNGSPIPQYIDVWPEHNVTAVRVVAEGAISYLLNIEGEEISKIECLVNLDNKVYADNVETIVANLLKGSAKYVDWEIERMIGSILDIIRDSQHDYSLLPGNLNWNVYPIKTKDGEKLFIDIYKNDTLVYSSPHSIQYQEKMIEVLTKVLNDSYQSNGLIVTIE